MSLTDKIAEAFARIKNAQRAKHAYVVVPSSNQVKSVVDVLVREGYVEASEELAHTNGAKYLKIDLKYHENMPVINHLGRVSKSGRRVYSGVENMPKVQGGLGILILTTPQGIFSDHEAKVRNVGGELIGECW
jgi:small subunit ribosomal protein S8